MNEANALAAFWRSERIVSPLAAREPLSTIHELAPLLTASGKIPPETSLLAALEARETQSPTFIGRGVALPHARLSGLDRIVIAVGASPAGIPWGPNGEPVYLAFAMAVPREQVRGYLELVSRISKVARTTGWAEQMAQFGSPGALAAALTQAFGG